MELCKTCSKPILSEKEDQVYCSYECWSSRHKILEKESALIVWSSIFSMLVFLALLLIIVFVITDQSELAMPLFTFIAGLFVFFVLKQISTSEETKNLFSFPKDYEIWRLIMLVIVLDVFVILPVHVAITTILFPNADQQEVITMFEEASDFSVILLAFTVSILTPFAEEFLFRGFILGMLMKRYSETQSIVASAIIFAVVHEPIARVLAFGGGLLYGWLRVRTGSIFPSIIAHAIWNGFITIVVILY